jgi:hypothetical protein
MQLGHLLTCSSLTHPEVCLMVFPGFFCLLVCSFLVFSVVCQDAFCLHIATNFYCFPVFCTQLELYLFICKHVACFMICPSVSCWSSYNFCLPET